MPSSYKVADVLNTHRHQLDELCSNSWKSRTLHALRKCRTAALGGHVDVCDYCKKIHISYNSCRNRHCPTCQGHKREEWIAKRSEELLDVPYFHVVFTLPHELNELALKSPALVYGTLFKTAWGTLSGFAGYPKNLGARPGMIALLHTWGQSLQLHPHLHCIVPSGGVSKQGKWKSSKNKGRFLFCVKAMSKVFRAKFVAELRKQDKNISQKLYTQLFKKKWIIYAKRPFKNTFTVIEYLGRYSHKVAISNHRITAINEQEKTVGFRIKNYRKNGKQEVLTLKQEDFIRRFTLHILPKGFTRIRHYGILSGTWKKKHLAELQAQLSKEKKQVDKQEVAMHKRCPACKKGKLITVLAFTKYRPPPVELIAPLQNTRNLLPHA